MASIGDTVRDLLTLYRDAIGQTILSLRRGWMVVLAIYGYALALMFVGVVARIIPNPLIAGLALGLADACAVGALLSLMERVVAMHPVSLRDIPEAIGAYFWDVIAVGFVLWIPLMLINMITQTSGYGYVVGPMVSLLVAVFFNPLPEVIYQGRTTSPLEALSESIRFVQQYWIEWFLPTLLVIGPLSSVLFFASDSISRGGLSFGQLVSIPALLTQRLADLLGLPPGAAVTFITFGAPVLTLLLLLFRGHLFAALSGTTSRQRAFRRRLGS